MNSLPVLYEVKLETDPRPYEIETESTEEFFSVCERQRAGEFIIREIRVGRTPGRWVLRLRYKEPLT